MCLGGIDAHDLDMHITGHYGEDQYRGFEKCDGCCRETDCTLYPSDCDGPYDETEDQDDAPAEDES